MAAMRTTLVLFAIVALAAAVPVAQQAKTTSSWGNFGALTSTRRAFSSGFSSGYSSGFSSGATPSPTTATATVITQVVGMTFPSLANVAAFSASAIQEVANFGYGKGIGIVSSSNTATAYTAGCTVSSTAVAARRTALSVTFVATVSDPTLAGTAQTAATGLTAASLLTAMTSVLTNLKASNSGRYGSITTPTVQSVAAPTVTGGSTTSGSSSVATFSGVAFAVAAVAALRR